MGENIWSKHFVGDCVLLRGGSGVKMTKIVRSRGPFIQWIPMITSLYSI